MTKNVLLFCRGHTESSFNSPHISSALVGARLMPFYGRPMPPADGFVPIWYHATKSRYWCFVYTSYFNLQNMSTNGMTYNLLPKAYLFLYLAEEHRLLHSYRPESGETHPIEKVVTRHTQWSLIEIRVLWACYYYYYITFTKYLAKFLRYLKSSDIFTYRRDTKTNKAHDRRDYVQKNEDCNISKLL